VVGIGDVDTRFDVLTAWLSGGANRTLGLRIRLARLEGSRCWSVGQRMQGGQEKAVDMCQMLENTRQPDADRVVLNILHQSILWRNRKAQSQVGARGALLAAISDFQTPADHNSLGSVTHAESVPHARNQAQKHRRIVDHVLRSTTPGRLNRSWTA
jgi:hypothetical protein